VFGISKFLFRGQSAAANMPDDVRDALQVWQSLPSPALDDSHFHVRYVVLDIATSGPRPDHDHLLAISAVGIQQGGVVQAGDAVFLDFSGMENDVAAVDRQLMAFLQFCAKAPVISYHAPYVLAFLQRAFKERLGIDFQPASLDLAWLLPAMFEEKSANPVPLDQWLNWFEMMSEGRRDSMANTLVLARLFQRLLVRAASKDLNTPSALLHEAAARSFLHGTR
jgi:DNA polymerase-3 subunit epsilon